MKPVIALEVQIKRILDQSPKSDWTAEDVRQSLDLKIRQAFSYDPARAPKTPTIARVRTVLSILSNLGHISLTVNWEGKRRFHTYERVIPEPFINIVYRDRYSRPTLGGLMLLAILCFSIGVPI